MQHCDALIVGGGPAGATCAAALRRRGLDVVVLDKATFPRPKLCAGWITPEPSSRRSSRSGRVRTRPGAASDDRLSRRPHRRAARGRCPSTGRSASAFAAASWTISSSAAPARHSAWAKRSRPSSRQGGRWLVNGQLQTPLLVAAGGHFCPVARLLGMAAAAGEPVVAAEEFEIELSPSRAGPLARRSAGPGNLLLRRPDGLRLVHSQGAAVERRPGAGRRRRTAGARPRIRPVPQAARADRRRPDGQVPRARLPVVRRLDAAACWPTACSGSATRRAWPPRKAAKASARRSSRACLAAQVIAAAGGDYRRQRLEPYRRQIEGRFGRRRQRPAAARAPSARARLLGRKLLTQRWFVRRVVLERWFLHQRQAVLRESPEQIPLFGGGGCPDTVCVRCQLNYQCRGIRYPQVKITKNRPNTERSRLYVLAIYSPGFAIISYGETSSAGAAP